MKASFTPRERIEAALHGQWADQVPYSCYWLMLPRGAAERRLREEGLAVVERVPVYRTEMPNCHVVAHEYYENGLRTIRETVETPVGSVYTTRTLDPGYGTSWWTRDYYVKRREDYRVLEYMVRDTVYGPNYDAVRLADERWGEDGYVIGNTEYGPMNKLIYDWLGIERFSLDLRDCPAEVSALYELVCAKHREMYAVAAQAPVELLIYDGNIHEDVVGRQRFERYYVPCLNAFADAMHEAGKLSACHLDARMRTLLPAVAGSRLDVVEAFTPVPTCDVTVAEARAAWPGKVLWVNFPSSTLLEPADTVYEMARRILAEAEPGDRFLIGITEDIPEGTWQAGLMAIAAAIAEHGRLPLTRP